MADKQPEHLESQNAAVPLHSESTIEGVEGASPQDEIDKETPFSDEELEHFKELILKRRKAARDDIERMRDQVQEAKEQANDNSAYSFHMADAGTDAMEREKLHLMIARQQKYIGYLDRALERIKNNTYGICRVTGKPIAKERLEAVPHTEISIEAKKEQKRRKKQNDNDS
ncbi:TraR/DksA family transcriptional regulator [Salisaeta longa]|uniref:TraR/DksA family transcriptional regulator n=1 Tax=Salisaeta longa TaxID=503170 RepID=UPI0003B4E35E|nr:TraR/DksA C4-type zinc finger protein [Salisaeta longa]